MGVNLEKKIVTRTINISSVDKVKSFVNIANKFACNATLVSGRFVIDAKSIMGVFSLDVGKPITLELEVGEHGKDDRGAFIDAIRSFVV